MILVRCYLAALFCRIAGGLAGSHTGRRRHPLRPEQRGGATGEAPPQLAAEAGGSRRVLTLWGARQPFGVLR